jgi:hypothetical protein
VVDVEGGGRFRVPFPEVKNPIFTELGKRRQGEEILD